LRLDYPTTDGRFQMSRSCDADEQLFHPHEIEDIINAAKSSGEKNNLPSTRESYTSKSWSESFRQFQKKVKSKLPLENDETIADFIR
jgi:hypothetical protein